VCRAAGCSPSFEGDVWVNPDPSPPLYPNVITLAPGAQRDAASRIPALRDQLVGPWAVKDSFSALDLSDAGFKLLFDAEWLYRPVSGVEAPPAAWTPVLDVGDLPPSLLDDPDVRFLSNGSGGVIANRGGGVIGLSNATGTGLDRAGIAAAASLWPGLPLVGYANGVALEEMVALGFEPVGPLRVWTT
jgi:hypothetical protein